jgi:hypothetical protein
MLPEKSQVSSIRIQKLFSIIFWYSQTPKLKVVVYKTRPQKTGAVHSLNANKCHYINHEAFNIFPASRA